MLIHVRQIACWEDETEFSDVNLLARKVAILDSNDPQAIQIVGGCTPPGQLTVAATAADSADSVGSAVAAAAARPIEIILDNELGDLPLDEDDGLEAIDEGLYCADDVAMVNGIPDWDALGSPSSPPERNSDTIRRL